MTTWLGDPLTISNSEIQTFKECRRKWWLSYYRELGLKRRLDKGASARGLGTRLHVTLCALYERNVNPLIVLDEIYAEDVVWIMDDADALIKLRKEQDLARAMIEGYVEWIAETGADDGLELVAAETVIEVPSGIDGVKLRGKLDQRIVRKIDGARLFLDHKSVAEFKTPGSLLPLDEQMKFYHLLERLDALHKTGSEPSWRTDGGLYNMLRKVKRTATAKPPFYERIEVRHNRRMLETTWIRVHRIIEEIIAVRVALDDGGDHQYLVPPRPSRDCTWKCDFFPICPMFDDGSNVEGLMAEYYEHRDPHERYAVEDNKEESIV